MEPAWQVLEELFHRGDGAVDLLQADDVRPEHDVAKVAHASLMHNRVA
jgi:hypothetical protein